MNFLAHIYLSGDDKYLKIGNFIADSIPGKAYLKYPEPVQRGIMLHREIDTFTDAHPVFRQSRRRLRKNYGHYSGVIVDIFYDHFLAKNWKNYAGVPLDVYVAGFYALLEKHYELLPENVQRMISYMIPQNWLLNYRDPEGIKSALTGLNRRTHNRSGMHLAISELLQYNKEFEAEFMAFFPELIHFSQSKIAVL